MLNKILKIAFVSFAVLLFFSCTEQTTNLQPKDISIELEEQPYDIQGGTLTKPNRHRCWCMDREHPEWPCRVPPHDCYPTIYVTVDRLLAIQQLDIHIMNNTVDVFFQDSTSYESIFPGFYGQALADLQSGLVTLRKIEINSNEIVYYAVMASDTNLHPSYYYAYNWGVPVEELGVACDTTYFIYR